MPVRSHPDSALDGLAALSPVTGDEWAIDVDVEPWIFGGGAQRRKHDVMQPLRPPSILGHLRFFFRLLASASDVADLRAQEDRVFGAASRPAPFRIDVTVLAAGTPVDAPAMTEPLGYLAFAARKQVNPPVSAAKLLEGARARIVLRGRLDPALLRAAKLWTLLGGVGGRTRRGLGAVQTSIWGKGVAALDQALRAMIADAPRGPKCGGSVRSIASMWRSAGEESSAVDCLARLEDWYRGYRQDRGRGTKRPGRSYWDEPELIRTLTGTRYLRHEPLPLRRGDHAGGWARAVLGLPIGFQFVDRAQGDPDPSMLAGTTGIDRMASALLFRPVRVDRGKYAAVVVRLSEPYLPPGGLGLRSHKQLLAVPSPADPDRVWNDLFARSAPLALVPIV
jgi:CRISPR-associated protein Cmr1